MDEIDLAQRHEEMYRSIALRAVASQPARDLPGEICTGCSYATKSNFGKQCEAWVECLQDLQRRERQGGRGVQS